MAAPTGNQFWQERKRHGMTKIFETPDQLESKVAEYFDQFKGDKPDGFEPANNEFRPTITGLCLFLGFESRQSFYDYEQIDGFSYTIRRSRMRIENLYESMLTLKNCTGSIFALKNMGWDDRQQIKHEGIPDPRFVIEVSKGESE